MLPFCLQMGLSEMKVTDVSGHISIQKLENFLSFFPVIALPKEQQAAWVPQVQAVC